MYHPPAVATSSAFEDEDFEFVELVNTSDSMTLDLENVAFTQGIEFSFPSLSLAAGERVVLVRNAAAFADRYGGDILVAGEYGALPDDFKLSNGGERLVLVDAAGGLIHDFYYDDAWYPETDGAGRSLEIADPAATELNLWGSKTSWLPSAQAGGTPGDARSASVAARAISNLPVPPSELRNDAVRARVAESRWIKTVDLALRGNLHGRRVPRTVATCRAPHWEGAMSTIVDTAKAAIG